VRREERIDKSVRCVGGREEGRKGGRERQMRQRTWDEKKRITRASDVSEDVRIDESVRCVRGHKVGRKD
jgi:hypothetical protein